MAKKTKIVFTVEDIRSKSIIKGNLFTNIFFKVNKKIPTITLGDKKPQVAYESYYSGNMVRCSQIKFYHPETYLLVDGRYKIVLEKNEDFHRAIRGLACFIQFGDLGDLNYSGNEAFGEAHYPREKNPNFKIKYASEGLEKRLIEI